MRNRRFDFLRENFGEPLGGEPVGFEKIGKYAGNPPAGAPDVRAEGVCEVCGMMPVSIDAGIADCECGGVCPTCGMMPTENGCACGMEMGHFFGMNEAAGICDECGMNEAVCECGMYEGKEKCEKCGMKNCTCKHEANEAKDEKDGPSPETAKKILKGTKTFAQKMKKVSGWAEDPAAAAAWMTHRATGKWPSEK